LCILNAVVLRSFSTCVGTAILPFQLLLFMGIPIASLLSPARAHRFHNKFCTSFRVGHQLARNMACCHVDVADSCSGFFDFDRDEYCVSASLTSGKVGANSPGTRAKILKIAANLKVLGRSRYINNLRKKTRSCGVVANPMTRDALLKLKVYR
jgi:hypothetical protein